MDLEVLEALALAEDRTKILAQLLPGSEEHDYHAVLLAQHRGELDRAETLIEAWADLHGNTTTLERLRLRQRLYRLGSDPEEVADDVRGQLGVSHWHTAEVAERDPTRPTRLSEETFDGAKLLAAAVAEASDLSRVTDDGIDALLDDGRAATLDGSRRRALLARAGHTASPSLVALVVADLESGSAFGTLRAHGALTSDQLAQVAERVPKLRNDGRWLEAVIRRMRPPADVVLDEDRDAREAYLRALWQLARELPAAANSLKAHVLWHLLDGFRQRDAMPERELVLAYLQLPRSERLHPEVTDGAGAPARGRSARHRPALHHRPAARGQRRAAGA